MPEISIIMPVYNTQQYLNKSIRSLLNQSFDDFELICVNDGSTDHSLLYLNALAHLDHRIKILDLPHGGVTTARIEGIRAAKGNYIGFVDSDDWVEAEYLLHLYSAIQENNADVSMDRYYKEGINGSKKSTDYLKAGVYRADDFQRLLSEKLWYGIDREHASNLSETLWTKLFRTELVKKNVCYLDKRINLGEDQMLAMACLLDSQCFVMTDFFDYHYRARGNSIVHTEEMTCEGLTLFCSLLKKILHQKGYASFDYKIDTLFLCYVAYYIRFDLWKDFPLLPKEICELVKTQSWNDGCEGWRKTVATVKEYIRDNEKRRG